MNNVRVCAGTLDVEALVFGRRTTACALAANVSCQVSNTEVVRLGRLNAMCAPFAFAARVMQCFVDKQVGVICQLPPLCCTSAS